MSAGWKRWPSAEDVLAKVQVLGDDDCWPWTGRAKVSGDGRGNADWYGRTHSAPRVVWAIHSRVMPPSHLYVCHTCNNPPCCNPSHLYLGTHRENAHYASLLGRTRGQKKTHCPQGHAYDEANTYRHTDGDGKVRRKCKTCRAARQISHKTRKAA